MADQWRDRPERGGRWITRFYIWLCLTVGRRMARPILYAIALYFYASAPKERAVSADYLKRVSGKRPGPLGVYRHFFTFSTVIMDRLFFLARRLEQISVDLHGEDAFNALRASNRGFILASAHFGSFEALRVLGISKENLPVKTLMYMENAEQLNALFADVNPDVAESVIPLGEPGAILDVKEWLDRKGIVGILADRITHGDKRVEVDFLGAPAAFPLGPWLLAGMLKVPVMLCFAVYRGRGHYDVHFEPFLDPAEGQDDTETVAPEQLAARFAERLGQYCRSAPCNWFNFFDFWDTAQRTDG